VETVQHKKKELILRKEKKMKKIEEA